MMEQVDKESEDNPFWTDFEEDEEGEELVSKDSEELRERTAAAEGKREKERKKSV
jgi:hypothetical protein